MRRETYCEGCGEATFRLMETHAAADATGEVEVLVWACVACGARTEVAQPVAFVAAEEADRARRVA